jgi:hypothetical protein
MVANKSYLCRLEISPRCGSYILTSIELKVKEGDKNINLVCMNAGSPQMAGQKDRIASQYNTVAEWEARKADLKPCLK